MGRIKKLAAFLAGFVLLVCCMSVTAFAATNNQDGLSVEIKTDKTSYASDEEIKVEITVKNTNDFAVDNVAIEGLLPEGLKLKSGILTKQSTSLAAGATETLSAIAVLNTSTVPTDPTNPTNPSNPTSPTNPTNPTQPGDNPQTGDTSNMILWLALTLISGTGMFLAIKYRKKARKFLSLILCIGLFASSLGVANFTSFAATETKSFQTIHTIKVDGKEFEIKATATYSFNSSTSEDPQLDETYKATFVLNDGSNGAYALQVVNSNSNVSEPSAPEKTNYSFTGWYTEPAAANKYDFSSPVTDNITLYAGWGSPTGDEGAYGTSSNEETTYSITGIEVKNGNVITTINVNSASALVVRFLDDDTGALIHMVSVQTPDFCELTPASIPVNFDLPEYYAIEADLYDSAAQKLCGTYQCIKYTSEYDEFDDLTVNDFGDKTVLNFDADPTNNFGVLNENVIEIHQDTNFNVLTTIETPITNGDEIPKKEYHFTYADSSIGELTTGDTILAKDINEQYQLFKIASITKIKDGEYSLLPSDDVELSDFYDTLKVDLDDNDEETQQPVKAHEQVQSKTTSLSSPIMLSSVNVIDIDTELSASLGGEINWTPADWLKINGSFTGTCKVEIEMIYDAVFFGKDYFSCSIITNLETKIEINVTATADNDDKIKDKLELAKVRIPTPIPGLTVYVAQTIPMEWSISGGANFTYTNTTKSGFTYDSNSGYHPVEKKESALTVKIEGKAELKFGPKFEVGIAFCEKVVKASIGVQAGIDATATVELGATHTNAESKHSCVLCISGECEWFVEVKAELTICIFKGIEGKPIDATLFKVKGPIKFGGIEEKFYLSVVNASDSMFGGNMKFGGGDCPNKTWRTIIKTQNSAAEDISGVNVTIKRQNRSVATTSSGELLYLADGIYVATATINGTAVSKSFVVNGTAQELILNPNSANGKLNGKVCTSGTDSVVTNATVLISQGEMVIASLTTDANGNYTATLPDGTYRIEITKSSYIPFVSYEKVSNAETTYLETALMVNGTRQAMGGFSGTITDAISGEPVANVNLSLREGWNNSEYSNILQELSSDSNGNFKFNTIDVFGVIFGMKCGNYTLTTSKAGYVSKSFNIVVMPGVVKDGQDTSISPVTATANYRIVLRWGNQQPSDLDSHYNAVTISGNRDHIYYSNKVGNTANLDVDDTRYEGPETVTVTGFENLKDGFVYSIHNYTNKSSTDSTVLSNSGAYVQVYSGDALLKTYHVPTDKGGTVWNVFSVDADGRIKDINTFEYISNQSDVGVAFITA